METQFLQWRPPEGYEMVVSALEGVVVYAPKKAVETLPDQQIFKCPKCGADTTYDPAAGSVTCAHCGYQEALHAEVVGRQAQEGEFTLETLAAAAAPAAAPASPERGWGIERRELHCEACGADLSLGPTDITTVCPFCGSNHVVNRQPAAEGLRPGFLIPFKVDAAGCAQTAREWLGRGWMFPKGLSSAGTTASSQGIYLPFWTFSADIAAVWKAEVGYEHTESYYDAGSKTTRTRTVIHWRWENGQVDVPVSNLLEPGTRNINQKLMGKIDEFDLGGLAAYNTDFLAGWQAKNYDIALEPAWDSAKGRMREMAKGACYRDIPTSHVRNFSMSADFEDESWRLILLPIYLTTYRYQDKPYQVMVNGQTGKIAGQKPVDWAKVWLAILAIVLPGIVVGLIGLATSGGGEPGGVFVVGAGLFIVGLVIDIIILVQAFQAGEGV